MVNVSEFKESIRPTEQQPTANVSGTILVSPDKKVLLVKGRRTGKWSFPKGHPNPNEKNLSCAIRETAEETGIYLSTSYDEVVSLYTGTYYIYYMKSKVKPDPQDSAEIVKADWWSLQEMCNLSINVDVSHFLRNCSI